MKQIMKFYLLMVVAAFIYSCDDPYAGETYQVYEVNPASTYLSSRADDFSEWIAIMKYADLYNAINQANESFTVFVPDNQAVQAFYQKKGVSSIDQLGEEYARELVRYHVLRDSVDLETFIVGGKLEDKTLSDDYLSVTFNEDYGGEGGFNSIYVNKEARVSELAISVSNGFVYVLDAVLSPLLESVYERLTLDKDNYGIFIETMDLTSWGDSLSVIYDELKLGEKQKRDYTVLAVSDEAFKKDEIYSVTDLIAKLGAESNYTDRENELFRYAAYHIMKGNYSLFDLQSFTGATPKRMWETSAEAVMEISMEEDQEFYINYKGEIDEKEVKAQFVERYSDVQAKNGVLHQIDAYLPIWESVIPVEVVFDFCNYPEVATYIKEHGTEGQVYQTMHASNEYRTAITNLPIFEVNRQSTSTPTSTYNYVDYFTAKTSNNWNQALNGDMMILNIGYMGSIAMKTPTLIAGKYKVTLHYGYATSMAFMKTNNGGEMQFTFDGDSDKQKAIAPMRTLTETTLGVYQCEVFSELEFEKTGAHTLQVVVTDSDAGTNTAFRLMLDYLHFEPIIE